MEPSMNIQDGKAYPIYSRPQKILVLIAYTKNIKTPLLIYPARLEV